MFSKKILANCASCDKNITNLLQNGSDHQNWNRLPFREPNERIARYGAGFSKILSTMKNSESAAHIRADHSALDEEKFHNEMPQQSQRFTKRSPSVNVENDASKHQITNRNLGDFNASNAMSPLNSGSRTINYSNTINDEVTTQDMTRVNAYKSAAKMKQVKKGLSPQPMKPMVNTTWDGANDSSLPNVRGAKRTSM